MNGKGSGKLSTEIVVKRMVLSSVSLRMKFVGAQYAGLGLILCAAIVIADLSVAVLLALSFSVIVSTVTQVLVHEKFVTDAGGMHAIGEPYELEPSSKQIRRITKSTVIQLPVIACLLVAQLFLFNWLSGQSDSEVSFGSVFLAMAAGAFIGFGLSSVGLGVWLGGWERSHRQILLEYPRRRKGARRRESLLGRVFIDARS